MKYTLTLTLAALVALTGCSSIKAYVDYDRNADIDSYKTFAWDPTEETSLGDTSPLMHERIKNAIINKVREGGMEMVDEDPDLYFTYHSEEQKELQFNTTNMGYGYGYGWGWDPYWGGGMGTSTTTVTEYTRGTLIIDAWDPKKKELVWRGTVEGVVPENPAKGAKMIDQAIDKLVKTWQKMKDKEGVE